jgi:hypothetical protein
VAAAGVLKRHMRYTLRMTQQHHSALQKHLFPGDRKEAVALLLCGRRAGRVRHVFTVQKVLPIPYEGCDRKLESVTWATEHVDALIAEAYGRRLAIVKVHSHSVDCRRFSTTDDESDKALFASISSLWTIRSRMPA